MSSFSLVARDKFGNRCLDAIAYQWHVHMRRAQLHVEAGADTAAELNPLAQSETAESQTCGLGRVFALATKLSCACVSPALL
eukprot:6174308-Pleurochrysis_carterae.AAC.1